MSWLDDGFEIRFIGPTGRWCLVLYIVDLLAIGFLVGWWLMGG